MTVLAWVFALLGAAAAYVVSLAGAMKTVPSLSLGEALAGAPLPLLAILFGALALARRAPGTSRVAAALPVGLACLTLLFMAFTYLDQPGGPR